MPQRAQRRRQLFRTLRDPQQRSLRIPQRRRLDQAQKVAHQRGIGVGQPLATAARPSEPVATPWLSSFSPRPIVLGAMPAPRRRSRHGPGSGRGSRQTGGAHAHPEPAATSRTGGGCFPHRSCDRDYRRRRLPKNR